LTFEGRNSYPVWSSDSTRIAFQSDREGDSGIFWQRADGATSAERLTKAEQGTVHVPAAWSPDGKTLLLTVLSLAGKQGPTRTLSMLRNGKVEPFGVATNPIFALSPVFSPDGQWVAYTATSAPENGDPIAWVQSFPPPSQKYRVVEGIQALWSREGEILAVQPGGLFGVRISTTPSFRSGSPQLVRRPPFLIQPNEERGYDMTSDGRILGVVETPSNAREQPPQAASQIQIIVNWFNELKPPAPAK
jgi:Tol biopolymer transport system component